MDEHISGERVGRTGQRDRGMEGEREGGREKEAERERGRESRCDGYTTSHFKQFNSHLTLVSIVVLQLRTKF